MTYQELYLQHLEQRFNEGGKQAEVEKAINEFNSPTPDGFKAWLDAVSWVACSTCGDSFKPTDLVTPSEPAMEILCKIHVKPRP